MLFVGVLDGAVRVLLVVSTPLFSVQGIVITDVTVDPGIVMNEVIVE